MQAHKVTPSEREKRQLREKQKNCYLALSSITWSCVHVRNAAKTGIWGQGMYQLNNLTIISTKDGCMVRFSPK